MTNAAEVGFILFNVPCFVKDYCALLIAYSSLIRLTYSASCSVEQSFRNTDLKVVCIALLQGESLRNSSSNENATGHDGYSPRNCEE